MNENDIACLKCVASNLYGKYCKDCVSNILKNEDKQARTQEIKITCKDEKAMKVIKKALEKGMIDITFSERES